MISTLVLTTTHLSFNSIPYKFHNACSSSRFQILSCSSSPLPIPTEIEMKIDLAACHEMKTCNLTSYSVRRDVVSLTQQQGNGTIGNDGSVTGGAYDFSKATTSVTQKLLSTPKQVTLVRHGLSSWNDESRVQGSSNSSILTETGIMQAERCKKALVDIHFDQCFSSPISRAKSTAEILWAGREEPLIFLDTLKEAHLFYLEGMKNEDAKQIYPTEYTKWREDPSNFHVNGVYPIRQLWDTASIAWKEILFTPGENFLVVTHKSILRALICVALGLTPERFRAFDVNNGGISVFKFNKQGEAMLQSLNMTAHMYTDHTYLY